jgi:methylmalonyl-CoA mutase, N-terminal domain
VIGRANDGEVPIKRLYAADAADRDAPLRAWAEQRSLAEPPYRPRFMVYTGLGSPEMTAGRLRLLQDVGAESFLLAADLPSQLGFDADHELAHAQVGRAGVNCSTLDDMRVILSTLDLDAADSVGMLANSLGHVGLGMISTVFAERGASTKLVMQNDPLKEFTARGTEIDEPADAVRIACDSVAYAIDNNLPGIAMTVCSNHYDVAGAGPILGMAIAFTNAIVYVDELVARGYAVADIDSKLMFFLNERSDLFVEAAVFRVARTIWSDILSERYGWTGPQSPATLMGYAHGLESAEEPLVNVPRCTLSVLASMAGGVDYLCATSYDEALRIPSADAAALAVRTMQVVAYEHGIANTVDPLAGSYKLRDVADYVYSNTQAEIAKLAEHGGGLGALHDGYIKDCIDQRRGARERQLAQGDRVMVGRGVYDAPQHRAHFQGQSTGEINFAAVEAECADRLRQVRADRDGVRVRRNLAELQFVASGKENLVPATIEALRSGATTGELVAATSAGFSR